MEKIIVIIGAGIGGLSAGCYARMTGYRSLILEMHNLPGGVCTSWKRKGYTFDGCIHHLAGCSPGSHLYRIWEELGVFPQRRILYPEDLVQLEGPDGEVLTVFTDIDRLRRHMLDMAPGDAKAVEEYAAAARRFTGFHIMDAIAAPTLKKAGLLAHLPTFMRWNAVSMEKYGQRFSNPFMRSVFPFAQYDTPDTPMALHLQMLAGCCDGYYGWPAGGSLEFARTIERRYLDLGGELEYKAKVSKIMVEGGRAVGVRLEDGSEIRADTVISNAYGRTTIFDMLDGRYTSRLIRSFYSKPNDRISMGIHISLGVARDLSREPHALILFLTDPVEIAGEKRYRLSLELFAFDASMAPEGKSVLKATLETGYSYWKDLSDTPDRYKEEKQKVADTVIDLLQDRFTGLRQQIEAVDVATPITTERYTGISVPFEYTPALMLRAAFSRRGISMTLPGLDGFFMVGQLAGFPSLANVAVMGRNAVREICRKDGKRFVAYK